MCCSLAVYTHKNNYWTVVHLALLAYDAELKCAECLEADNTKTLPPGSKGSGKQEVEVHANSNSYSEVKRGVTV